MKIHILYFARLRETLGTAKETLEIPAPATLALLLDTLRGRGGMWAEALAVGRNFRLARNQDLCPADTVLADGDEVAIFPPVTGG
ncbi:MAG: molybdopterin converting factor subunit 1 [Betaproteobacteria bacterium]|jgi:sulfur-carrier protein|nr:MAG: molybdopterin converting factor subunit 1 [Betaproteobacteria bacterium]